MSASRSVIDRAGAFVVGWVVEQMRLRAIVRRPYAVINGEVVGTEPVVFYDPEAMR